MATELQGDGVVHNLILKASKESPAATEVAEKVAEMTLEVLSGDEIEIALDGVLSGAAIGAALQALWELEAVLRTSASVLLVAV